MPQITSAYEQFSVQGVKPEDIWKLFNVSNFSYYCAMVDDLQSGKCPFCQIDWERNKLLFSTAYWYCWENTIAPRDKGGNAQEHQFVIPCRRHITHLNQLEPRELVELGDVITRIDTEFSITGGVIVIRSGDHKKCAKSVDHVHVNYHVPTGNEKVQVTIAKSMADIEKKLPLLRVFEKVRQARLHQEKANLTEEEKALLVDRM